MNRVPDPHHWNTYEPNPRESEAPEPDEELENQETTESIADDWQPAKNYRGNI